MASHKVINTCEICGNSFEARADRAADRDRKGRMRFNAPSGEAHYQGKLTKGFVDAIRADTRSQRLIAVDYGVHQGTISQVKTFKIWR